VRKGSLGPVVVLRVIHHLSDYVTIAAAYSSETLESISHALLHIGTVEFHMRPTAANLCMPEQNTGKPVNQCRGSVLNVAVA
jgi:hypothetical protein